MRLMCDEMLRRLGRWLRAAGYDTAIAAAGDADAALLARCAAEGRVLVTRDRDLAARAAGGVAAGGVAAVRLAASDLDGQARTLRAQLGLDWQRAPFTRCLVDNAVLAPAPSDAGAAVPPASRAAGGPLFRCPECGRLYWPGGHVRRMSARLQCWNGGLFRA